MGVERGLDKLLPCEQGFVPLDEALKKLQFAGGGG